MHKITVNKSDEPTLVAEKIIDAEAKELLLLIPRFSKLSEAVANFRLLKREADALGKKLVVETVDDKVMELCKIIGIECVNAFFGDGRKQISDIVTAAPRRDEVTKFKAGAIEAEVQLTKSTRSLKESAKRAVEPESSKKSREIRRFAPKLKPLLLTLGLLIILVGGSYLGISVLPKAEIKIVAARTSWSYNDAILVDRNLTVFNAEAAKVPGQIFSERKNLTLSFPASGRKRVERKAAGKIIVYNAHSSASQTLVATTRFETPEGKIFRIIEPLTVPGAQVVDGKIRASSVEAKVLADKAGEDYNIGPVARFTIPGFKGTPKFNTFYGESREPIGGGFIGEAPYPTDDDIKNAKTKLIDTLEESIRTLTFTQLPKEFKLLEGADQFKILKQTVDAVTDAEGKFSVFAEGELILTVFREPDLFSLMEARFKAETSPDFEVKDYTLNYGPVRISGRDLSFAVNYEAVLAKKIDAEDLKQKIAGKPENELRALIFSVPGIERAQIRLWPFFVRSVPKNPERIHVAID